MSEEYGNILLMHNNKQVLDEIAQGCTCQDEALSHRDLVSMANVIAQGHNLGVHMYGKSDDKVRQLVKQAGGVICSTY